jgi:hypothetical protein
MVYIKPYCVVRRDIDWSAGYRTSLQLQYLKCTIPDECLRVGAGTASPGELRPRVKIDSLPLVSQPGLPAEITHDEVGAQIPLSSCSSVSK